MKPNKIIPVILAGGVGTRLWPMSRESCPKQFLALVDENTLLQNTVLRLMNVEGMAEPVVVCNRQHKALARKQLYSAGVTPAAIIIEPYGRNTAPALAIAALHALNHGDDPLLLILPADHHISAVNKFHETLQMGCRLAQDEYLVTFGIVPDSPETGFGYIQKGDPVTRPAGSNEKFPNPPFTIARFVEKPDLETAKTYLQSGDYCWNSGMFLFKASLALMELKRFVPDIVNACESAFRKSHQDAGFCMLDEDAFRACPSDSIDYAVMERTGRGVMVPLDAGWTDLGSWETLWRLGQKDDDGNVIRGNVITRDVKNSYLYGQNRLVTAIGLENHVVIDSVDALFISPRNRDQEVKTIVKTLKDKGRSEV